MDARVKDHVVRNFQYKNASTTQFSCAATTADGNMAVGTKTGEVRLFSHNTLAKGSNNSVEQSAPRAKTKLVGYGDAILGMDATRDGKFILATCATYIQLIPSEDESGKSGFQTSAKHHGYRLCLQPSDIIKVGGIQKVRFTPAKFNVTGKEHLIVSSTGNWLITWDFSELITKKPTPDTKVPYSIQKLHGSVIGDDFSAENQAEVVAVLQDDVIIHETKLGRKPEKK